jgi:hypothetical protein
MSSVDSKTNHVISGGHRKRRFFAIVDKTFQWKYASLVAAMGMALVSGMGLLLYSSHVENTSLLLLEQNPELLVQVQAADRLFLLLLAGGIIFIGTVLLMVGLLVTHRMSGPMYLARRYISLIGQGGYPEVRDLRSGDEFKDFFDTLNRTVHHLRSRDTEHLRELEETLAFLRRQDESLDLETRDKLIQKLEQSRDDLQRGLSL